MIKRIHHIGIAVTDLAAASQQYRTTLDTEPGGEEDVISARTRVQFFKIGETRLELLSPLDPDAPVARHLDKRGPGIHHICLEVDDIEAEIERMRGEGMQFVTEEAQIGAHDTRIIFLHPRSTGGVLIELQQPR
jgi:methylmalonyl-CoA/ethylmalonyl-CoA epimerase